MNATMENLDSIEAPIQPKGRLHIPVRVRRESAARERGIALAVFILPALGTLFAFYLGWHHGLSALDLGLFASMYVLTMIGSEGGLHRLFAHRAFRTNPVIESIYAILGMMAAQGPLLFWAAVHRRHHATSERAFDPHSPYIVGEKRITNPWRGFWHAHMGWMLIPDNSNFARYVPDIMSRPHLFLLHRLYFVWILLGLALPALIGGLLTMSWYGALTGLLWGGFARLFAVHHVIWSSGSWCHLVGTKPYATGDESRNNALFGLLSFGVGWHNNHHAFPGSARCGLKWWQIDINYYVILLLEVCGLAHGVRRPTPEMITRRLRASTGSPGQS